MTGVSPSDTNSEQCTFKGRTLPHMPRQAAVQRSTFDFGGLIEMMQRKRYRSASLIKIHTCITSILFPLLLDIYLE